MVSQKQPERCFINLRVDNNKNDERSNQLHYYLEVGGARGEEGCVGDLGAGESSKTGRDKSIVFKHCQTVKLRGENLARDDTFEILASSTPFSFAILQLFKSGIFFSRQLPCKCLILSASVTPSSSSLGQGHARTPIRHSLPVWQKVGRCPFSVVHSTGVSLIFSAILRGLW